MSERKCRICGCTDNNCQQCIEKTGKPCHWIADDLCSTCANENQLFKDVINGLNDDQIISEILSRNITAIKAGEHNNNPVIMFRTPKLNAWLPGIPYKTKIERNLAIKQISDTDNFIDITLIEISTNYFSKKSNNDKDILSQQY